MALPTSAATPSRDLSAIGSNNAPNLLRLDERERIELADAMKAMKEKGEEALKRFQERGHGDAFEKLYEGWNKCPICEGAAASVMLGIE